MLRRPGVGLQAPAETSFTIQASWMGSCRSSTRFLATDLLHHPHEADGVGFGSVVVLWSTVLRLWVSRTSVLQSSVWRLTRASVVSLVRELPETLYFTICPFRKTDPIGLVPMVKQVCG